MQSSAASALAVCQTPTCDPIPVSNKRRRVEHQLPSSSSLHCCSFVGEDAVASAAGAAAVNCFKEKKLKLNRSAAAAAVPSAAKRRLSIAVQGQAPLPSQPAVAATAALPVSDGDYRITVGEELTSPRQTYQVLSYLGRGTFGQVVKGWNARSSELVAVKILKNHPSYARQGGIEAEILQLLCREDTEACNIVRAVECFTHRSHLCLVFELLDQNLYDYLKAHKFRPLALREIRPIAQQVLSALSKLKSLGLIHADLKPENIMLVHPGEPSWLRYRVKVIDFGSACFAHKAVTATYLQSRYYRAPEILLGLPFNEGIDMWSLGCVLAELFMGWPLYPGSSEYDQIRYIVETQGYPSAAQLKVARKTNCFFNRHPYSYQYQLKPADQYLAESRIRSREVRKYRLSGLDQLAELTAPPAAAVGCGDDAELERADRAQFCDLVKRLLRLEARSRATPDEASSLPFVTMAHLQRWPHSSLAAESRSLMRVCHRQPQPPPPPEPPLPPMYQHPQQQHHYYCSHHQGPLLQHPQQQHHHHHCCGGGCCIPLPPLQMQPQLPQLPQPHHHQPHQQQLIGCYLAAFAAAAAASAAAATAGAGRDSCVPVDASSSGHSPPQPPQPPQLHQHHQFQLRELRRAQQLQRQLQQLQQLPAAHRQPVQVAVCHPFSIREDPFALLHSLP